MCQNIFENLTVVRSLEASPHPLLSSVAAVVMEKLALQSKRHWWNTWGILTSLHVYKIIQRIVYQIKLPRRKKGTPAEAVKKRGKKLVPESAPKSKNEGKILHTEVFGKGAWHANDETSFEIL